MFGKDRSHPARVDDAEPRELAEQHVVLHPFHQLPFRANREQADPDQPLRQDLGAPELDIKRREFSIQAGKGLVHNLTDLAQQIPRGNAYLQIDIAKNRSDSIVRLAHHHHRR